MTSCYVHPKTLSIVVVSRIDCYAVVEGYGLHSGHVAMSSGVAWSRLRKQGVKFATVELSRCSLSIACLNVGHSLRRRAMPVFVGFHMRWPVSSGTGAFLRAEKQERYETSWRTIGRDDSYPVLGRSEP